MSEELKSIVSCLTELVKTQKEQNEILSKQLENISQQLEEIKAQLIRGVDSYRISHPECDDPYI